jgi:hypothetical protein
VRTPRGRGRLLLLRLAAGGLLTRVGAQVTTSAQQAGETALQAMSLATPEAGLRALALLRVVEAVAVQTRGDRHWLDLGWEEPDTRWGPHGLQ